MVIIPLLCRLSVAPRKAKLSKDTFARSYRHCLIRKYRKRRLSTSDDESDFDSDTERALSLQPSVAAARPRALPKRSACVLLPLLSFLELKCNSSATKKAIIDRDS